MFSGYRQVVVLRFICRFGCYGAVVGGGSLRVRSIEIARSWNIRNFFRLRWIRGIRICHYNSSRQQRGRPHVLILWRFAFDWRVGDYKTVSELGLRRYLYYNVFRGLLTETDIYIFCSVARVEVCRTVVSCHQHHYRLAVWYTISFLNSKTPIISGNIKLWAILWLFFLISFFMIPIFAEVKAIKSTEPTESLTLLCCRTTWSRRTKQNVIKINNSAQFFLVHVINTFSDDFSTTWNFKNTRLANNNFSFSWSVGRMNSWYSPLADCSLVAGWWRWAYILWLYFFLINKITKFNSFELLKH